MTWAYLDLPGPNGFAHRGGNVRAPENTLAAFEHAVGLGYSYLETDVHLTRDGVLVAFHDQGLDRVAGLSGVVADYRWDELVAIDLGEGARIPRMDDLLSTFPTSRFNIDPKADDAVAALALTILRHHAVDRVCVGSFSDARILEMQRRIGPDLCTSPGPRSLARLLSGMLVPNVLGSGLSGRGLSGSPAERGYGAIQVPPTFRGVKLSQKMVEYVHQLGLEVHVWTINTEAEMRSLLDLGVDAVMTDDTELLKTVMTERGEW